MAGPQFLDTQPADLPGDGNPSLDEFRVRAGHEMIALLRRLMDGSETVNLTALDGGTVSTTVWTLDPERGRLSFAADGNDPRMGQLVDANMTTVVAYLEAVKLQFDVRNLVLVHGPGGSALQAELPQHMYRFQRRKAFRVKPLARTAPVARLRHPMLPDMTLELRVLDVSIGGCALFLANDIPPMQPGVVINNVRIEIDGDTRFDTTMRLQHVSMFNLDSGGVRLGCEFLQLSGQAERSLQKFIDQTQKRRRLLSLD